MRTLKEDQEYLQIIHVLFIISMKLMNTSYFFAKFCIDKRREKI
jgi:hypothetical protein